MVGKLDARESEPITEAGEGSNQWLGRLSRRSRRLFPRRLHGAQLTSRQQNRAWVALWREIAAALEEVKARELRALTEEETGRMFADLTADADDLRISPGRVRRVSSSSSAFSCAVMSIQRVIGAALEARVQKRLPG